MEEDVEEVETEKSFRFLRHFLTNLTSFRIFLNVHLLFSFNLQHEVSGFQMVQSSDEHSLPWLVVFNKATLVDFYTFMLTQTRAILSNGLASFI